MRLLLAAAVAAGVLFTGTALAQAPRPARALVTPESTAASPSPTTASPTTLSPSTPPTLATNTVVLDVALVFKSHLGFKRQMEEIRGQIDLLEREFGQQRQKIAAEGARLRDFRSGSPEYKKIEERMARELNNLRIETFSRKNELLEREGKVYHETYAEVYAVVARLANQHNISLVIRYDSESTDEHDRGSLLKAINRAVVYQRGLDITKLVIEQVNANKVAAVGLDGSGLKKR